MDLNAIVQRVVSDLRGRDPARAIEVSVGRLPGCDGDPSLLEQVLINLLSNAFKFTRDVPNARVEIDTLTAAPGSEPAERVYFVRDNGAGFDMKYADNLFGVFQRMHSREQFEGTGVGLSIVQRILQRHGGRIWAESAPSRGATFYFVV